MRRLTNGLLYLALALLAADLLAQTPDWKCKPGQTAVWVNSQPGCTQGSWYESAPNVYPGYWHANSVAIPHYAPCPANGLHAYTAFTDPDTGLQGYFRYDFSSFHYPITQCPGGHSPPCQFASGGGPNHTNTWVGALGFETPMLPGGGPINYYPAPVANNSDLCPTWAQVGNTTTCPGTENYVIAIQNNPVYSVPYQLKLPSILTDPGCSGVQPTSTPVRTPTATLTPTRTPTPGPDPYAAYWTWAKNNGITGGCSANPPLACPNNAVTREQEMVFLWKLYKLMNPGAVLGPCQQQFNDVVCVPSVVSQVAP